jgi:hypothetical protein
VFAVNERIAFADCIEPWKTSTTGTVPETGRRRLRTTMVRVRSPTCTDSGDALTSAVVLMKLRSWKGN